MAGGDLEARVEMSGKDEVADMAAALEVFRRHALEALRLNQVEQLANQLQDKNEELEGVLTELRKAQDQIVMREKLAALGELTAGVAHEIRNPLNFVNNFSEASGELIEELQEVLTEEGVVLNDEQRDLVKEITEDLTSNVVRIRSHGERANRIVQDMLRMGRDSGDWQATDINSLLEQHARLAYHSARATNQQFQVDIQEDYDSEVGKLEVIPQQLGRVFLNIVSNACYATDQRRRAAADAGPDGEEFSPILALSTRRKEDGVEVHIRDNGTGMPPDVVEKIFNPFFTTKPTDQGTGLGLAISNDIVRRHGGSISVETEPGEGTTMIVNLLLERPLDTPEESHETVALEPAL
jgi:signal transduction histidine kinase